MTKQHKNLIPNESESDMRKWVYCSIHADSFDSEEFNTKKEAIQHAKKEGHTVFRIGRVSHVGPHLDIQAAVENSADEVYHEVGELAERYLTNIPKEFMTELEDEINAVFQSWLTKHKLNPTFFLVEDVETITLSPPPEPATSELGTIRH